MRGLVPMIVDIMDVIKVFIWNEDVACAYIGRIRPAHKAWCLRLTVLFHVLRRGGGGIFSQLSSRLALKNLTTCLLSLRNVVNGRAEKHPTPQGGKGLMR